jgi:hypothetical protein
MAASAILTSSVALTAARNGDVAHSKLVNEIVGLPNVIKNAWVRSNWHVDLNPCVTLRNLIRISK